MSKVCAQCGCSVEDNATFCTQCGNPMAAPQQPETQPTYQQPAYQQPAYQQPAYQQPAYQQPAYQQPAYQQPAYQQPMYQQPMYQQPVYQQTAPQPKGNGAGTAGMVLGIIGFVFALLGFILFLGNPWLMGVTIVFWVIALILSLPGIGLSLGGSIGKGKPKGKAIAGLILNGLILILWIYLLVAGESFFWYL